MSRWEAPAKLNLSLLVGERDAGGYHPLRSLVQTIEWVDYLTFEEAESDQLTVEGAELPEGRDNLVWKAIAALREAAAITRPLLDIGLKKHIPASAGLGGGSSDAAASLLATARLARISPVLAEAVAPQVGADVPFLMVGGTAWMEGYGEQVNPLEVAPDYALGVVVPPFELATSSVYSSWDHLGGPPGPEVEGRRLPPSLRTLGPLRNDLTPAAISVHPDLADWMSEMSALLERPMLITGSGPAMFGFFADLEEAISAMAMAPSSLRAAMATTPRPHGPTPAAK